MNKTATLALTAAGVGIGGYYLGSTMDATTPPSSALSSKEVLFPALAGLAGFFFLKKKSAAAAKGAIIGGLAGAIYGYYKQSSAATSSAATSGASWTPYAGYGYGQGAYLGRTLGAQPPAAVRRIMNSPRGSGIRSILPRRLQSGSPAFPKTAWSR